MLVLKQVVVVDLVDVVVAEQDVGQLLVAFRLEGWADDCYVGQDDLELQSLVPDFLLDLLYELHYLQVGLAHVPPHPLQHLTLLPVVLPDLLVEIRYFYRHEPVSILDQLHMVDQHLAEFLLVLDVVVVLQLLEEPEGIEVLEELARPANSVNEPTALLKQSLLDGLGVNFAELLFGYVQRRDESEGE